VIQKTRLGMMIRAGASNREMVQALGINVNRLFAFVFSLGVALAAFAGMLAAPVDSVYPGMGENILIISFVVVVIGGTGSIKGAFVGAMLIGLVSTFGKVLLPEMASMTVYALPPFFRRKFARSRQAFNRKFFVLRQFIPTFYFRRTAFRTKSL
jgi:branched-chain amino acid transport system permease protein